MWSEPFLVSRVIYTEEKTYIFRDAGFSTTSLGISAKGVLDGAGGVNDVGGNPGTVFPVRAPRGRGGVLVGAGPPPGSRPDARNLSSRARGLDAGVKVGAELGVAV